MADTGGLYRSHLDDYSALFDDNFVLRRENGVLEVRMHTGGGPLRWTAEVHRMLIPLFQFIDHDEDNEVVILTGTGDTFNAATDLDNYARHGVAGARWDTEKTGYDLAYRDQVREPLALLFLGIPVICAINGPVSVHTELALLNDLVLCSDTARFSDGHWKRGGIVPGDGVHTVFRELLGPNRANYLLYTGESLDAAQAHQLGLVGEVVTGDELLPRARELAQTVFLSQSRVQRRLARALLMQPWRERFVRELAFGMAHESLACALGDQPPFAAVLASRPTP